MKEQFNNIQLRQFKWMEILCTWALVISLFLKSYLSIKKLYKNIRS
jgi:hypothetical protein